MERPGTFNEAAAVANSGRMTSGLIAVRWSASFEIPACGSQNSDLLSHQSDE